MVFITPSYLTVCGRFEPFTQSYVTKHFQLSVATQELKHQSIKVAYKGTCHFKLIGFAAFGVG